MNEHGTESLRATGQEKQQRTLKLQISQIVTVGS